MYPECKPMTILSTMNHYRLPKLSVPYLRFVGLTCLGLLALLLAGCAPSSQAARPLVYVALGASDSVGVGAANPVRDGWVPQLQRRLPPGTQLVNLGISGFKLSEALTQELPVALDTQPDLVTVWLAVNDFNARVNLTQYERDLDRLLTALVERRPQRILMGNVPALERVPVYNGTGIAPNRIALRFDQIPYYLQRLGIFFFAFREGAISKINCPTAGLLRWVGVYIAAANISQDNVGIIRIYLNKIGGFFAGEDETISNQNGALEAAPFVRK